MKYFFLSFVVLAMFACENTYDCSEGNVCLQVLNHSSVNFDTLLFNVSTDAEHLQEIVITDLDAGESSSIQYLDQLNYMYYDEQTDYLFFTNSWQAVSSEGTYYGSGYGFCGTGLQNKTVDEGNFYAEITGIDDENNVVFITQTKD